MPKERRIDVRWLGVLLTLTVLVHTTGSLPARADLRHGRTAGLQQGCGDVPGTPYFTEYYGTVTLDGAPAPAGTVVEAYSPRGDRAGCVEVIIPGFYPYLRVYREDPSANPPIPGMQFNDEVTFKVNGNVAQSNPSPIIWTDDRSQHSVNLNTVSAPCYNFNDTPGVDLGDITLIAGTWRATDAGSLAGYDFNHNSVVDIADIMTVAAHLGEPCS